MTPESAAEEIVGSRSGEPVSGPVAVAVPAAPAVEGPPPPEVDSSPFLNREVSWLEFNRRVLHEADDPTVPLLERLKFVAIFGGNLDEFFMKRVGALKNLVAEGHEELSIDGRTPQQQLAACRQVVEETQRERESVVHDVLAALRERGIGIAAWSDLSAEQRLQLREHFVRNIFPLVTPLAMDPAQQRHDPLDLAALADVLGRERAPVDQFEHEHAGLGVEHGG